MLVKGDHHPVFRRARSHAYNQVFWDTKATLSRWLFRTGSWHCRLSGCSLTEQLFITLLNHCIPTTFSYGQSSNFGFFGRPWLHVNEDIGEWLDSLIICVFLDIRMWFAVKKTRHPHVYIPIWGWHKIRSTQYLGHLLLTWFNFDSIHAW